MAPMSLSGVLFTNNSGSLGKSSPTSESCCAAAEDNRPDDRGLEVLDATSCLFIDAIIEIATPSETAFLRTFSLESSDCFGESSGPPLLPWNLRMMETPVDELLSLRCFEISEQIEFETLSILLCPISVIFNPVAVASGASLHLSLLELPKVSVNLSRTCGTPNSSFTFSAKLPRGSVIRSTILAIPPLAASLAFSSRSLLRRSISISTSFSSSIILFFLISSPNFSFANVSCRRSLFTSCPILVHKVYQGMISANRCKKIAYEMRSPTSIQSVFKGA
mmetsp:Transcript_24902/g.52352  ORF Transcript_24902/g.52352 Transcript_24902/m.52352 type:complete len:278 (-) Transcript_24902:1399-2232(-)